MLTVGVVRALIKPSVPVAGCWDLFQPGWWWWTLSLLAHSDWALLVLLVFGWVLKKNTTAQVWEGLRYLLKFFLLPLFYGQFFNLSLSWLHHPGPAYSKRLHQAEIRHSPSSWDIFPSLLLTMHYLVTEASQALLPSLWWIVLSAPQWPQWLANPDTTLNGFSRNLIAPQFPKDTTILWLPLQSPSAGWKLKFNQRAFFLGTDLSPFQALFLLTKKCSKGRTKVQRKHVISQHLRMLSLREGDTLF